jgi:hypothetical protein
MLLESSVFLSLWIPILSSPVLEAVDDWGGEVEANCLRDPKKMEILWLSVCSMIR